MPVTLLETRGAAVNRIGQFSVLAVSSANGGWVGRHIITKSMNDKHGDSS